MEKKASRRLSITRREMLTAMGGAATTVGLAGCGVVVSQSPQHSQRSKVQANIKIPESGVKIPSTPLTFGWMDSDDLKAPYEQAVFDAYHKAHPNVSVNYNGTGWDEINQAIPLAVRNGNPPDIFAIPNNVPVQVAINGGWVAPIDDVIPNFKDWKASFPPTAFIPGVHIFNGRTYSWPASSNRRYSFMLFYDVEYLQQAGYDPAKHRFTWDSFRTACRKITKRGNGQYYALMSNDQQPGNLAMELAQLAGVHGSPFGADTGSAAFNWKTGTYNYTRPEVQAAFELLLAIKSDGSFFPGYLSLDEASARARMPQRVAAMIFDGPWNIPKWPAANPSYKFNIGLPPTPNSGKWNPSAYQETSANQTFVAATSKAKEVAADLFAYMGSLDGQTHMVILSEGNLQSEIPAANERAKTSQLLNAHAKTAVQIADNLMRMAPLVQVRNPQTDQVILAQKPVKPSLRDVGQGIMSGQIKDVKGALQDLQNRSEQSLDDAIKTAQAKGVQVSRDDWKFTNWDPTKDYTNQDYQALH